MDLKRFKLKDLHLIYKEFTIKNKREYFFKSLNIRINYQVAALIETTKQILQILSGKDKKNISLAASLLLIKTVLDVLSVGLIVPILHPRF